MAAAIIAASEEASGACAAPGRGARWREQRQRRHVQPEAVRDRQLRSSPHQKTHRAHVSLHDVAPDGVFLRLTVQMTTGRKMLHVEAHASLHPEMRGPAIQLSEM